jgi:uncharacterized protein (DUF58 family)
VERLRRLGKPVFVICLGVVLYLIATNAGAGWLYVVAAAIGGVVLISALGPLWSVRGIEVARLAPVAGTAGEPISCEIEVRNPGRFARYLIEARDAFAGDEGGGVVVRVEGGAAQRVAYRLESPRRGVYPGGGISIESGAPFGLFYGRRRVWTPSSAVIYPRTFPVAGLPPAVSSAASGERESATSLDRGPGGELWGVREYRPGDPAQLIAWRPSARSLAAGRLAVVEMARETRPPLTLALDLDPRAPKEAREMVISAGASLMLRALEEGREVVADAGPQPSPFPERPDRESVLAWCAALVASRSPRMEGSDVAILPSLGDGRAGSSEAGTVVLVSCYEFAGPGPWMAPEEERALVRELEDAGRRVVRLGPEVPDPWSLS